MTRISLTDRRRGSTDQAALAAMTDEDIVARAAADPDAAPLDLDWTRGEIVVPPRKVAISIRLDQDLIDHFKRGGDGYQSRINAVLRAYVSAHSRDKPA